MFPLDANRKGLKKDKKAKDYQKENRIFFKSIKKSKIEKQDFCYSFNIFGSRDLASIGSNIGVDIRFSF